MSLWIERNDVEWLSGELKFWQTRGDSGQAKICAFCGHCGSRIYHAAENEQAPFSFKAGTLDDTSWLNPTCHLWIKRKQSWLSIDPASKGYEEGPKDDGELMQQWQQALQSAAKQTNTR